MRSNLHSTQTAERIETPARRRTFKLGDTTTAKSSGYVVLFRMGPKDKTQLLRMQSGDVSWSTNGISGTIFEKREHAQKAIDRLTSHWRNNSLTFEIVSVGNAVIG